MGATAVVLLVLLALLLRTCVRRLPSTVLNVPLLLYLVFATLACVVSPLRADALQRLIILFLGIVVFYLLVGWLQNRPDRIAMVARSLALLGAAVALGSLFVVEWPSRHLFDVTFLTSRLPHLSGPLAAHANGMAGLLLLLLPLAVLAWKEQASRRRRLLWAVPLAVICLTFLLTQSRNGWLALLVAGGAALLWQRRRFAPVAVLLLFLVFLPFLVAQLPPSSSLALALDKIDATTKAGSAANQSWLGRLEMWAAATKMMADYPLLGAGLYTFEPVSRANYVYEVVRPEFPINQAHNLFLHTGAGLGWPGWLAAVVLWLSLVYGLWRASGRAPAPMRPLGRALGASILGYLSFNTWDVLALEQRAGLLIWLVVGLAVAYTASYAGSVPGRRLRLLQTAPLLLFLLLLPALPRNLAHLRLDRVRLGGGAAGVLQPGEMSDPRRQALVYYLQGRPSAARLRWAHDPQAVPFLINQGQQAYIEREETAAVGWYEQALALDSTAAAAYYWRGLAYEALAQHNMALADYRRTVALAEDEKVYAVPLTAAAWDRQGRLLAQRGAWQAAAEAFVRASTLAPRVDDFRQRLEGVLQALAEEEAEQ